MHTRRRPSRRVAPPPAAGEEQPRRRRPGQADVSRTPVVLGRGRSVVRCPNRRLRRRPIRSHDPLPLELDWRDRDDVGDRASTGTRDARHDGPASPPRASPPSSARTSPRRPGATTSGSTSSPSTSSSRRGSAADTARASAVPCTACCSSATSTTAHDIATLARAQCAAEGVIGLGRSGRARWRAARSPHRSCAAWSAGLEHWRELFVAAMVGDRVLEGYIDLLVRTPEGLVIVDYKTDQWSGPVQTGERARPVPPPARGVRRCARIRARRTDRRRRPRSAVCADGPAEQIDIADWSLAIDEVRRLVSGSRTMTPNPHRTVIRHRRDRRPAELEHALGGQADEHAQAAPAPRARRTRSRRARRSWRAAADGRRTAGSSRRSRRRCRRRAGCAPGRRRAGHSTALSSTPTTSLPPKNGSGGRTFEASDAYSGSNPAPTRYWSPTFRNR